MLDWLLSLLSYLVFSVTKETYSSVLLDVYVRKTLVAWCKNAFRILSNFNRIMLQIGLYSTATSFW